MYTRINDFLAAYKLESACTERVLGALTDASLATPKGPGDISAGDLAWHVATAAGNLLNHEGADLPVGVEWQTPSGLTAAQVLDTFKTITAGATAFVEGKFQDADLSREATWFGHTFPLGVWLNILVNHEVHHRGQLTMMMRQAGLTVPSIYGPNKEETAVMMAKMAEGLQAAG